MAVIGGKLFSNHPKNMNHVHKYSKDLVAVIIIMSENISGGDTVFYDGVKTSDLGIRSHVLKHLHGRMILGLFEKNPQRYSLERIYIRNFLYCQKTNLPTFLST